MPVTDIFVGGAGDRIFKCAKTYVDKFAADHPTRQVIYLPQGSRRQLRQILETLPAGQTINIIGHSWGAADVAWALAQTGSDCTFDHIIGIDPVGKFSRHIGETEDLAQKVISVHAVGSEGRLIDGNITARIARQFGAAYPAIFEHPDALKIDAPFAHYDVTRMMRHPDDDGVSVEDRLLGRTDTASSV